MMMMSCIFFVYFVIEKALRVIEQKKISKSNSKSTKNNNSRIKCRLHETTKRKKKLSNNNKEMLIDSQLQPIRSVIESESSAYETLKICMISSTNYYYYLSSSATASQLNKLAKPQISKHIPMCTHYVHISKYLYCTPGTHLRNLQIQIELSTIDIQYIQSSN